MINGFHLLNKTLYCLGNYNTSYLLFSFHIKSLRGGKENLAWWQRFVIPEMVSYSCAWEVEARRSNPKGTFGCSVSFQPACFTMGLFQKTKIKTCKKREWTDEEEEKKKQCRFFVVLQVFVMIFWLSPVCQSLHSILRIRCRLHSVCPPESCYVLMDRISQMMTV